MLQAVKTWMLLSAGSVPVYIYRFCCLTTLFEKELVLRNLILAHSLLDYRQIQGHAF